MASSEIDEVFGDKIETTHHFSDNLYAKEIRVQKGGAITQHRHNYSHLSLLAKGKVRLITPGEPDRILVAPAVLEIVAGRHHAIEALEDSTWFCIHAIDTAERDSPFREIEKRLIQED